MAFSLSQAAAHEIRARLKWSRLDDPAASLHDAAPAPNELVEAVERASPEERLALAQKEFARLAPNLQMRLNVGVYASSECRPQDLVNISGVRMILTKELLGFLANCRLEYENERFLLRKGAQDFASMNDFASAITNAT